MSDQKSEITEQLKQLTEVFSAPPAERPRTAMQTIEYMRAEAKRRDELDTALAELECKLAIEKARISPLPPIVLTEEQAKSAGLPSVLGLLGKHAWTLKCLTDDVRSLSKMLYGDQRANATLALRHLEDAHHRMTLAQASESTTVSSDKQKIENLARQCVRNAETIKDLRAKLE